MTEIEKLDRIAINVESHRLLKQLLNENPDLEEIPRNSQNETEIRVGVKEWIEKSLKERTDAFNFYHAAHSTRELFERLEWRDYAIIRILDYIDHAGKQYRSMITPNMNSKFPKSIQTLTRRFRADEGINTLILPLQQYL